MRRIIVLAILGAASGAAQSQPPASERQPVREAAQLASKWGIVTSVRRSPAHNRAVGGAVNSFHLYGRAIDVARRPGVSHGELDAAFRKAGFRIVESLDEGDHSHFAFGSRGWTLASAPALSSARTGAKGCGAGDSVRRRPDKGCPTSPDQDWPTAGSWADAGKPEPLQALEGKRP